MSNGFCGSSIGSPSIELLPSEESSRTFGSVVCELGFVAGLRSRSTEYRPSSSEASSKDMTDSMFFRAGLNDKFLAASVSCSDDNILVSKVIKLEALFLPPLPQPPRLGTRQLVESS
jgi:hypothetical protein